MEFDILIQKLQKINPDFAYECAKQGITGTGSPHDSLNPDGINFMTVIEVIALSHLDESEKETLLTELITDGIDGFTVT